ncbi:MAG: SPOR domain-containing protein [bacterium]|nr:SPOR domain-containing protein [bacterium]
MGARILIFGLVFLMGCGAQEEATDNTEQALEQMIAQSQKTASADSVQKDSVQSSASLGVLEPEEDPVVRERPTFDPVGKYLLQVGAYQQEAAAKRVMEDLRKMRYPAQVVQGKGVFRVRIGFFSSVSDAKAVGKRLQEELGLEYWVANR